MTALQPVPAHSVPRDPDHPSLERPVQPHVPRARADHHAELALRHDPLLHADVPVAEIAPPELERHPLALAGAQLDLLEAPQLLGRARGRGRGHTDVQLGDLCASDGAGVGDYRRDGGDDVEQILPAAGADGAGRWAGHDPRAVAVPVAATVFVAMAVSVTIAIVVSITIAVAVPIAIAVSVATAVSVARPDTESAVVEGSVCYRVVLRQLRHLLKARDEGRGGETRDRTYRGQTRTRSAAGCPGRRTCGNRCTDLRRRGPPAHLWGLDSPPRSWRSCCRRSAWFAPCRMRVHSLRKLAARADVAVQNVDECITALLTWEASPDDGDNVGLCQDALKDDRTDAVDDNDRGLPNSGNGGHELIA